MTSYATALNAGYGQGTYVASASSEYSPGGATYPNAWYAFDKSASTSWVAANGGYNTSSPYNYTGSVRTVDVNGTSYSGDWLQIQMPSSIILSTYSIKDSGDAQKGPGAWSILGSRDGAIWFLVDQRSGVAYSTSLLNFSVTSAQTFTYYRMVITNATGTGSFPELIEWTLNGSIESVNVTPDGRVGLGVVNPTRALEVAGDIVCTGTVSSGTGLMFRNALYNGDMRISQRGTSFTNPSGQYTLDRWYLQAYGAVGNGTVSQIQSGLVNFSNAFQLATTSTSTGNWMISQSLETRDVVRFQGQAVTVSFWYRIPTNFTQTWSPALFWTTSVDTAINNGVAGPPNTAGYGNMPNTTAWTYTQFQAFVPSTAQALSIIFSNYNNVVNGATIQITGVQLEKGSVATPFEILPYGTQLALCQRYYQKTFSQGNYAGQNVSGAGAIYLVAESAAAVLGARFITTMRAIPVVTLYNPYSTTTGVIGTGASGADTGTATAATIGDTGFRLVNVTVTSGAWYQYHYTASAEL